MALQIRMQADDFFKAYQVLEQNYAANLTIMGPSIVCLALALELYLKDLHFVLTGQAPRTHDLHELFENLPPQTKQDVLAYDSISQNPFMIRGNILSSNYYSRGYSAYDRFGDQLKAMSKSFVQWRYSYESNTLSYDSSFALAFIEAIMAVVDHIRGEQYTLPNNGATI